MTGGQVHHGGAAASGDVSVAVITRRVFQNVSALTLGQLFYRLVMLGVSILLARHLGVVEQGAYALVMNFIAIFAAFSDLGIANLVIRDMNQRSVAPAVLLGQYLTILLFVNGLLLAGAIGTALALGYAPRTVEAIGLAGLGMLFTGLSATFYAGLAGMERMKRIALSETVLTLVLAGGMVVVMLTGGRLIALTVVAAVGGITKLALLAWPATRLIPGVRFNFSLTRIGAMLWRGLPFTLHAGLWVVLTKIDVVLLDTLSDDHTLGYYTAATRLTWPLILVSMMTATAIFPIVSRTITTNPALARALVRRAMRWLLLLGLCIAAPISLLSGWIVGVVFGQEFLPAADLLRIVIWYIPIFYSYQVVSDLLVAADRVWGVVLISAVCLVVNITSNMITIPLHGAFGSAWTAIGCELLRCVLFIAYAWIAVGLGRRDGGQAPSGE